MRLIKPEQYIRIVKSLLQYVVGITSTQSFARIGAGKTTVANTTTSTVAAIEAKASATADINRTVKAKLLLYLKQLQQL